MQMLAAVKLFDDKLEPMVNRLHEAGMWVSADVKRRILKLAGE